MPGDRPGEDGAGAVHRRDAHLAAGPQGSGDLAEGDRRVVDDLEHVVAEREIETVAAGGRKHLVQQVAVALEAADARSGAGGVGPAAQGGQGVGAGVDDGHVVTQPGEGDGEHAAAAPDVEDPQRGAGADDRVERGPDGGGPGGQLLRGRRGRGRRHAPEPSGGRSPSPARRFRR